MKPEFTRPFSMADAKAGAPYCCVNGDEATAIKWDCRDLEFPIAGVMGDYDNINEWDKYGRTNKGLTDEFCLVMLPLGMIDGKPVFMGDLVTSPDCKGNISADLGMTFGTATSSWRWPAPAKVYPVTGMTNKDMADAVGERNWPSAPSLYDRARLLINAALRHALDSGAIVTKEDHEAGLKLLGDRLRDVAISRDVKRDMAIAKAVILACTPSLWYSLATSDDLMRIIAGIK